MKRLLVLPAVAAFVVSPAIAQAASFTLQDGVAFVAVYDTQHTQGTGACTGAGCEATASYLLDASAGTLTINLSNTSSDTINNQNILTALFFDSTPDLEDVDANFSGGMSTWDLSFNQGSFEINTGSSNGVSDGLDDGDSGTVVISFSNVLSSLIIDDSQVHFQSLVGNTGQSDKLTCCEEQEGEEGEGEEGEGTTPEPASLLLLGSALTAAGFRLRRVRR